MLSTPRILEVFLLLEEQAGTFSIRATKPAFQFHRSEHPPPLWLTDQTYRKSQGFFQPPQCSRQTLNCKAKGQFKAKLHRTWPILLDLVFPLGKAGGVLPGASQVRSLPLSCHPPSTDASGLFPGPVCLICENTLTCRKRSDMHW